METRLHRKESVDLALARARVSRRRREGGAVMFVVAMTLAVLASVGMYALAAASTEIKMSGNERQNTQTHYLAEYGVLGTADQMTASKVQFYVGLAQASPDFPCVSLPGVKQTDDISLRACRRLSSTEISSSWQISPPTDTYGGAAPFTPAMLPGSLGPIPMTADFFVEITSPTQTNAAARYSTNQHFCFVELTATSIGVTQPLYAWLAGADQTGKFAGEGLEMQRARYIAGPVVCAQQ